MARMPIELVTVGDIARAPLEEAIRISNSAQSQFVFAFMPDVDAERLQPYAFTKIYAPDFLDRMGTFRDEIRGYHPYIVAFADGELAGEHLSNLFASDRPEAGIGVATIANVSDLIVPSQSLSAYFVYRLAKQTLSFVAPHHKNHRDTRDCVYDAKINKPDILRSMKARALCDPCRNALLSGVPSLSAAQLSSLDSMFAASGKLLEKPAQVPAVPARKHRVFIGSSTEGLRVAYEIQLLLHNDFAVEIWNQGTIFGLGNATLEDLEAAVLSYDFGIFVFTPDDQLQSRGQDRKVARDNVIFEFGLFVGKLTRKRAFVVRSREVSLPSDLAGINTATYDPTAPNLTAALGPACHSVRGAIENASRAPTQH